MTTVVEDEDGMAVRIVRIVIIEMSGIMAASGCVVDEAVAWGSTSLSVRWSVSNKAWVPPMYM